MKSSEEVRSLRRLFAVGHGITVNFVLLPLLPLALGVATGADVVFWAGRSIQVAIFALLIALALPALGLCFRPTSRFYLTSVWLPMGFLAATSIICRSRIGTASKALMSPMCADHVVKHDLEQAYEDADGLYGTCIAMLVREKGGIPDIAGVADCSRYRKAAIRWGKEFNYLASLEDRYPCAGMCYGGRRLWEDAGELGPPCGPFVAQALDGARLQVNVLLAYSLIVIVLMMASQATMLGSLVRRYDHALMANSQL
mmetsp:Transcript_79897/g.230964  ORF Transcript_79897/g.230964 Transcript_79897/m.230964 type:complete len:256 (+) Transcript_79897:168-935(+)